MSSPTVRKAIDTLMHDPSVEERGVRMVLDLSLDTNSKRLPPGELRRVVEEALLTLDFVTFVDAWVTEDSDA